MSNKDAGFVVKDSGKRQEYPSGMRRDTQEGKTDYDLIPEWFLERFAQHLMKGAAKYGENNWQLANSEAEFVRFRKSAFRHYQQWRKGDRDEDHAMAVVFNLMAAEHTSEQIKKQAIRPKKHRSSDIDLLRFMDMVRDAIPGHPNISWVVDEEEIRLYIVWIDFRVSKVIDRTDLEQLYEPEALIQTLCEEIVTDYMEKRKPLA